MALQKKEIPDTTLAELMAVHSGRTVPDLHRSSLFTSDFQNRLVTTNAEILTLDNCICKPFVSQFRNPHARLQGGPQEHLEAVEGRFHRSGSLVGPGSWVGLGQLWRSIQKVVMCRPKRAEKKGC